jgi:WD40 repeat protein
LQPFQRSFSMTSSNPAYVAATTETDFQSFSAAVLKPLLQFITTECLASLPTSALDISDFLIQLLTANKEFVNQMCRGIKTNMRMEKPSHPRVSHSESLLKCKSAISSASKRRDANFLREVFDRHKDDASGGLSGQNLIQALTDADAINVPTSDNEVDDIMKQFDADSNKVIQFGEFQQVVNEPDELQVWLSEKQLPLAADALRPLVGRGSDQLKKMSQLSPADIEHAAAATCSIIPGLLKELHQELQDALAIQTQIEADMKADLSKFNDFYKMACGTISDFHKGLTGRVGMPHLNFKNAMRQEHCERTGCGVEFTTGNYKITTTPRREWQYIVDGVPCPDMGHNRRLIPISELLQQEVSQNANLSEVEVIAIVLYTGPMFQIYNTILRRFPEDKFSIFKDGDNLYSTTIFVLVSAVQKLSRFTRIPLGTLLYRGLGGKMDLPDIFFQIDSKGCSGYAEWAFLSTTSDRNVALGYSGVKERRPKAMVMVIETSSIDRGADISEFSQYPGEKEFLYLPCSFVQRVRQGNGRVQVVDGGLVTFFPVKINLNIKTQTVEELQEQKKSMHIVSARSMLAEVTFELTDWIQACTHQGIDLAQYVGDVSQFFGDIVGKCKQVVENHEQRDPKDFADDETNRCLITEVLDTKSDAISAKKWQQTRIQTRTHKYEAATCVATLGGHNGMVCVAFHPTAPLLATGSEDCTAKLWLLSPDQSSATCVATLAAHDRFICSLAFHPTAPLLATCSQDKTAKFWRLSPDYSKADCVQILGKQLHASFVLCVAFHRTLPLFATGCADSFDNDHNVFLWQLSSDQSSASCVASMNATTRSVMSIDFHPTAPVLASGSDDNTAKLWLFGPSEYTETNLFANLVGHSHAVISVAFHPSAPLLATGSQDCTAKLWRWRVSDRDDTAICVATLLGHKDGISSVSFNSHAPILATGSVDCTVKLWRLAPDDASATTAVKNLTCLMGHPCALRACTEERCCDVCFRSIETGCAALACSLCSYDLCNHCSQQPQYESATCVATLECGVEGESGAVRSVAFHPSSPIIATGFLDANSCMSAKLWL